MKLRSTDKCVENIPDTIDDGPDGVCGLDGIGNGAVGNRVSIGVLGPPLEDILMSMLALLFPAVFEMVFETPPLILFWLDRGPKLPSILKFVN